MADKYEDLKGNYVLLRKETTKSATEEGKTVSQEALN